MVAAGAQEAGAASCVWAFAAGELSCAASLDVANWTESTSELYKDMHTALCDERACCIFGRKDAVSGYSSSINWQRGFVACCSAARTSGSCRGAGSGRGELRRSKAGHLHLPRALEGVLLETQLQCSVPNFSSPGSWCA